MPTKGHILHLYKRTFFIRHLASPRLILAHFCRNCLTPPILIIICFWILRNTRSLVTGSGSKPQPSVHQRLNQQLFAWRSIIKHWATLPKLSTPHWWRSFLALQKLQNFTFHHLHMTGAFSFVLRTCQYICWY